MDAKDDLIDGIYEAAFVPELWSDALGKLCASTQSSSSCLIVYDEARLVGYAANGPIQNVMQRFQDERWWQESRRMHHFIKKPITGFVTARDYFGTDFLKEEPEYQTRRDVGLDDQVGTILPMPSGELVVYAFDRHRADGTYCLDDIALLDMHLPHLARAGLIAARLRLERAQATAHALQALGLPAAVLSQRGRVTATNALFDGLDALFLSTAFGGVAVADFNANNLFRRAVEEGGEAQVHSIPVRATESRLPLVIHVLPLRRSAHDIFSGADILVAVTALHPGNAAPSPAILTGLFDLSPTEAKLATGLCLGKSLRELAAEFSIAHSSVRKYLDRVFLKTGTHRQAELVALLKGAQPPACDRSANGDSPRCSCV
jgi:DNA-binding CsgD family transcriptional regulator